MSVGLGGLTLFVALHFVLLIFTAAVAGTPDCGSPQAWACGGPFEAVAEAAGGGFSFGALLDVMGGLFQMVAGLLLLDYDVLKGDGVITGGIGFIIRAIGWVLFASFMVATAASFLGR